MKVAYADPPYVGCGHLYPEQREVDHVELIARLEREYPDGWALSCHSPSLRVLLPLCPDDVRVGAWVKPFGIFKINVNPGYLWEPVIWRGGRKKRSRDEPTVRDWISAVVVQRGFRGAKPEGFCWWLFDLLGLGPDDELHDLFPGTGIVTETWQRFQRRERLDFSGIPHEIA